MNRKHMNYIPCGLNLKWAKNKAQLNTNPSRAQVNHKVDYENTGINITAESNKYRAISKSMKCIGGLFFSPIEVLCMYQRNRIIDWMANICEKCFNICQHFTVPYTQRDVWWNQTGKALYSSAPEAGSMPWNIFALYCTLF